MKKIFFLFFIANCFLFSCKNSSQKKAVTAEKKDSIVYIPKLVTMYMKSEDNSIKTYSQFMKLKTDYTGINIDISDYKEYLKISKVFSKFKHSSYTGLFFEANHNNYKIPTDSIIDFSSNYFYVLAFAHIAKFNFPDTSFHNKITQILAIDADTLIFNNPSDFSEFDSLSGLELATNQTAFSGVIYFPKKLWDVGIISNKNSFVNSFIKKSEIPNLTQLRIQDDSLFYMDSIFLNLQKFKNLTSLDIRSTKLGKLLREKNNTAQIEYDKIKNYVPKKCPIDWQSFGPPCGGLH